MLRSPRLVAIVIAVLSGLAALLAFDDGRVERVVPQRRFGNLTPIARAHFARRAGEFARSAEPGAPGAAAMYAAAARSAIVVSGGVVGGDTVVVNYATALRWCPGLSEPNLVQVEFVREAGTWRVLRSGPFPC